jgi:ribosomal protein L18E
MRAVRKSILFAGDDSLEILKENPTYPNDYNFSLGYWGSISKQDGISGDSSLSIKNSNVDFNQIKSLINEYAKENKIASTEDISEDLLYLLRDCDVSLGVKITLTNVEQNADGTYNIKMLIPSNIASKTILGIIMSDGKNCVEFYNIEQSGDLISFDISKFADYYIVTESVTNLYPIISFLTILLCAELLALIIVAAIHINRKRKERNMTNLISTYALSPLSLPFALRIEPQNGGTLTVLLAAAALALGCGIAILAKLEINSIKKQAESGTKKSLKRAKQNRVEELIDETEKIEAPKKVPILCSTSRGMIDATEEDFDIEPIQSELESELECDDSAFSRRAEVNLDVIANHFESGELVTLDAMKKKRIVSKKTDYVKVLARGILTKPLIIEAHDFSHTAQEMLRAVGGEAIRIKKQ